jgi:hypothetical protein
MSFTDDEVLLLLDLDFETPSLRFARLRALAWWVALGVGSVAGMLVLLQADYGFQPPHVAG